jgi:CheY-like chemotaxis protein
MVKPLALVVYERLLPGSQLVNRLPDLGYRVQTLADGSKLVEQAQSEKPLIIIIDLATPGADGCATIKALKATDATAHIPILALADPDDLGLQTQAQEAGASLVASGAAILAQLPELLQQALRVD